LGRGCRPHPTPTRPLPSSAKGFFTRATNFKQLFFASSRGVRNLAGYVSRFAAAEGFEQEKNKKL